MSPQRDRRPWVLSVRRRAALLTAARRRAMPPAATLRKLGLRRGMSFLDVGCGPGYFTLPASRIVGKEGAVLACDISPTMLREVRQRARRGGARYLALRRCRDTEIPFADGCSDMALLAFVVHEASSVGAMLSETRRALRPGGTAAFIEWHPRPTAYGPPQWARFRPTSSGRFAPQVSG